MIQIAKVIADVLKSKGDQTILEKAKETTKAICEKYPLFHVPINV